MYTPAFFRTKLGHASLASVAAMVAMIALTNQVTFATESASLSQPMAESAMLVELA